MAFRLKTIRNNQSQILSIEKILELLGEKINDEIRIDGKAYRISSFESLTDASSGTAQIWQTQNLIVEMDSQEQFPFSDHFTDTDSLFLLVNNSLYSYGINKDYHIESNTIYWHGDFNIETSDEVYLKYLKTI